MSGRWACRLVWGIAHMIVKTRSPRVEYPLPGLVTRAEHQVPRECRPAAEAVIVVNTRPRIRKDDVAGDVVLAALALEVKRALLLPDAQAARHVAMHRREARLVALPPIPAKDPYSSRRHQLLNTLFVRYFHSIHDAHDVQCVGNLRLLFPEPSSLGSAFGIVVLPSKEIVLPPISEKEFSKISTPRVYPLSVSALESSLDEGRAH